MQEPPTMCPMSTQCRLQSGSISTPQHDHQHQQSSMCTWPLPPSWQSCKAEPCMPGEAKPKADALACVLQGKALQLQTHLHACGGSSGDLSVQPSKMQAAGLQMEAMGSSKQAVMPIAMLSCLEMPAATPLALTIVSESLKISCCV